MSKRIIAMLWILALCLSTLGSALAQPEPYNEPICKPEEVDLRDVQEKEGRLVGIIHLPESPYLQGEVRIDCPVPQAFPAEQAQALHVTYTPIDKKTLQAAIEAIGQSTKSGELHQWSDANQFMVSYSLWEGNAEPCFYDERLLDVSQTDDPACAQTYSQAKDITRKVLAQLGAATYEPLLHANRYDAEHVVNANSYACYSNGVSLYQNALTSFRDNAKKYKHTEEGLTMVSGLFELYGLPVMYDYTWGQGENRTGASSEYHAIVSDRGELRLFDLSGLPTVKSIEPLALPAYSWQEMVAHVACGWWLGNPMTEAMTEVASYTTGESYTIYPVYAVITEIRPCWIGYERGQLVPGYYMNVENRTVDGDTVTSIWSSYGDAETLTLIH